MSRSPAKIEKVTIASPRPKGEEAPDQPAMAREQHHDIARRRRLVRALRDPRSLVTPRRVRETNK
jgi:hypothetical protein